MFEKKVCFEMRQQFPHSKDKTIGNALQTLGETVK